MLGYIQALIDVNERELSRMISNVLPNNPAVKKQEHYIRQLKDLKEFYMQHEVAVGVFKLILDIRESEEK